MATAASMAARTIHGIASSSSVTSAAILFLEFADGSPSRLKRLVSGLLRLNRQRPGFFAFEHDAFEHDLAGKPVPTFPDHAREASAGEAAFVQKGLLRSRRGAPKDRVAVRKSAKTPDNIGMQSGPLAAMGIARAVVQRNGALLIGKAFRM